MLLQFLFVFFATWSTMSLIWLYLDHKHSKHDKKLETIKKIVKENNLNREQAEKLYDLFMN